MHKNCQGGTNSNQARDAVWLLVSSTPRYVSQYDPSRVSIDADWQNSAFSEEGTVGIACQATNHRDD
jgi:hypothetical protein